MTALSLDLQPDPMPGDWSQLLKLPGEVANRRTILVHAPTAAFQAPGGGEVQLVRTAIELARLGLPVRPFCPWTDRLASARLLHLFGMCREGLELARVARSHGVPVVLSPICWFEPLALLSLAPRPTLGLTHLASWAARRLLPSLPSWRAELLSLANAILPNSHAEASQLVSLFRANPTRVHVIPNGVDASFEHANPSLFRQKHGASPFVLFAGRLEPRKNLLSLIRAMKGTGLKLHVLGDPVPGHEAYASTCLNEGRGFASFHPRLPPDDPLLASAFAAARVLALPSWFETPGLVALEAALCRCSIVVTSRGCTKEYFGVHVEYAEPNSIRSIRGAVLRAWQRPASTELAEIVRSRYLWSLVARRTAEVYDQVAP